MNPAAAAPVDAPDASLPIVESPTPTLGAARAKRVHQYEVAHTRRRLVDLYKSLQAEGRTPNDAAAALRTIAAVNVSRTTLDRWALKFEAHGFDGLVSNYERCGRRPETAANDNDKKVLAFGYLRTNATADRGSMPEAARLGERLGAFSPEFSAEVRSRVEAGLPAVPRSLSREVAATPATVRAHRSPTESGLQYVSGAGVMRRTLDAETGELRRVRSGEGWESDDGTINLGVCIPWPDGGCKVSERYRVKLGRFQWLPMLDIGSNKILGYSYTCRERGSYRSEDVLSLMHAMFRAHGMPRFLRFERGVWEAAGVEAAMRTCGVERWTAFSPHQKLIEGCFNSLWTKLSILPGQVGRFRGEEEEAGKLYERCKSGSTDPRLHFPMLADVLAFMDAIVAEKNATLVRSPQYGEWVPDERWARETKETPLRSFDAGAAWVFAPCRRELTVRGNRVATRVAVTDDWSVEFVYQAAELRDFDGARVALHFDPFGVDARHGTIVLAESVRDRRAGEVLCTAEQVSETARQARRLMRWGDDADVGREVNRATRQSLRREVRAILAGGKAALRISETRDGVGGATRTETCETVEPLAGGAERQGAAGNTDAQGEEGRPEASVPPARIEQRAPAVRRRADPMAPLSAEEHAERRSRTAALTRATRAIREREVLAPAITADAE
jgi:hypothetical protein